MIVYITQYALSKGIMEFDGRIDSEDKDIIRCIFSDREISFNKRGKNWHINLDDAKERAEEMRVKSIASAVARKFKLENMMF